MSSYRPLRFLDASARADEIVANYKLGIGTHSQSSEVHVLADAPEIRVQDEVSEVTETALRITADGGAVSFQSGVDFTNDSKGDIKFQSMLGATTHMTIDGTNSRVGIGSTQPTAPLDVVASSEGDYIARFKNSNTGTDEDARIMIETSDGGGEAQLLLKTTNEVDSHIWHVTTSSGLTPSLAFQYGGNSVNSGTSTAMTITNDGHVGINTSTPESVFSSYGGGLHDGDGVFTSKVAATLRVSRGGGSVPNDIGYGAILEFRHDDDYRHATIESVSEATYSEDIGLLFKTVDESSGPVERMRIGSSGNVGIGISDVDKTGTSSSADGGSRLIIHNAGEGNEYLRFDGERPWVFKQVGAGSSSLLCLQDKGGNKSFLIKDIDEANCFVFKCNTTAPGLGIGVDNPWAALHIKQTSDGTNTHGNGIRIERATDGAYFQFGVDADTGNADLHIRSSNNQGWQFNGDLGMFSTNQLYLNDAQTSDDGANITTLDDDESGHLIHTYGNNGGLWQVSGRGGLAFGSGDDCMLIGAGDNWDTYVDTEGLLNVENEDIFLLCDGEVRFYTGLQSGWASAKDSSQWFNKNHHYFGNGEDNLDHLTVNRYNSGSYYASGYSTSDSTTGFKIYSDNNVYMVESDENQYPFRFDVNSDKIYLNGSQIHSSDDRLKFNEKRIQSATATLMKLDPQVYDKKRFLHSNVMFHEAGFIAQDVWYDVPEMRHMVQLSDDAEPSKERPYTPDDIQDDPDWEGSGWGEKASHLDYTAMIPYIVKSIQEIVTENALEKTRVAGDGDLSGLVVSARSDEFTAEDKPVLTLSNVYCDKAYFGVVSDVAPVTRLDGETLVNTRGTGRVWVLNAGSSLAPGDYVTTSSVLPGYACKQADDITRSYTVAKVTQTCDFTERRRPKRVVRRELSNVNYYVKTNYLDVTEEVYNTLDPAKRTSEIETYYEWQGRELVKEGEPYDFIKISPEITLEDYEALPDDKKTKYKVRRFKNTIEESTTRTPGSSIPYETKTRTLYKRIVRQEYKTLARYRELEVRQEMVDVVDADGQLVWEDHPTETEPVYEMRYLTADGQITTQANAVHVAALVGVRFA